MSRQAGEASQISAGKISLRDEREPPRGVVLARRKSKPRDPRGSLSFCNYREEVDRWPSPIDREVSLLAGRPEKLC